jgi:hypothetical protein
MLSSLAIFAAIQIGLPPPNVSRGIAAYERGDFATALTILKPIVYDVSLNWTPLSDPWATAYLAQMFRRGEGTAPDWPLSCALFHNVFASLHMYGPGSDLSDRIPFVADGIKEVCLPEQTPEMNALRSACYLDGLTRREFVLDGGAFVVVDRLGFHLDLAGEHRDIPLTMRCHEMMIAFTEADISIPDGSSNHRIHFLELFKWTSGINTDGQIVRHLQWVLYEVRGVELAVATDQSVWTVVDSPYPSTDMPDGVREAVTLRVNPAGDVEWLVRTTPVKRGIIRKP